MLRKRGITDVFVVGLAFDYCVGLTACDAAALGFNTYVVEDLSRCVADGTVRQSDIVCFRTISHAFLSSVPPRPRRVTCLT